MMLCAVSAVVMAAPAQFARIDLRTAAKDGRLEIVDKGGAALTETPRWLKGGALFQFKAGKEWQEATFKVKAVGEGKISIILRGPDVRKDGKRIPSKVDFKSLTVNGKTLLGGTEAAKTITVWHDASKSFVYNAADGEELTVSVVFRSAVE